MDDFNLSSLMESKNEWSCRLLYVLSPCVIEGLNSIFEEAYQLCLDNNELNKYLMTFQNLLNNVPKWSAEIVDTEKTRILETSNCSYLDDLLTCVHIIQLKALTCARVGTQTKKLDIDIPNINVFIHRLYINVARKVYVNVYLFEKDISPLQIQKHNRELEILIKEAILNTIRDGIPVENILRAYIDTTQETDVEIEEKQEIIIDKEQLHRQQEIEKQKELEKIKDQLSKELDTKTQIGTIISDINKNINSSILDNSITNKQFDFEINDIEIPTLELDVIEDKKDDDCDVFSGKIPDNNIDLDIIDL
jgi:hypothetical protein